MQMLARSGKKHRLLCCYAEEDRLIQAQLEMYLLDGLSQEQVPATWQGLNLSPGRYEAIEAAVQITEADIILLLVSEHFKVLSLGNPREIQRILERERRGDVSVYPIVVRKTSWVTTSFGNLRPLPSQGGVLLRPESGKFDSAVLATILDELRTVMTHPREGETDPEHIILQLALENELAQPVSSDWATSTLASEQLRTTDPSLPIVSLPRKSPIEECVRGGARASTEPDETKQFFQETLQLDSLNQVDQVEKVEEDKYAIEQRDARSLSENITRILRSQLPQQKVSVVVIVMVTVALLALMGVYTLRSLGLADPTSAVKTHASISCSYADESRQAGRCASSSLPALALLNVRPLPLSGMTRERH